MAAGVVNVLNMFNPEVIVLGGKLYQLGSRYISRVTRGAKERALAPFFEDCKIVYSKFPFSPVALGAALCISEEVIRSLVRSDEED